MNKVLFGIIAALSLALIITGWRYVALSKDYGRIEQSNKQMQQDIEDLNARINESASMSEKNGQINGQRYEEAMKLKDQEMQSKLELKQHEIDRLRKEIKQIKNKQPVQISCNETPVQTENTMAVKEDSHETLSEKCLDQPVPDFFIKQLQSAGN